MLTPEVKAVENMSLLPFFSDPFCYRPSRILNQHFGLGLDPEEIISAVVPGEFRNLLTSPFGYYRPWVTAAAERDTGSTVTLDKDKFQVNLDVQQFSPNEITVRASGDDTIEIEGKHEEKEDKHGYISRHFVRKYKLPKGTDIQKVQSTLSSDGVLTITAPRTDVGQLEQRTIPIEQTGAPAKAVENKPQK